ncbi:DUF6011 domain-containing protein [Streptacidiphilus sp. EB129]|uniref:DUF6011 domain-containing protein n=1 Tax=Streptacidiphilus sp. EB129 TaxID=3156262 RepID=UPI0035188F13
MTAQLPLLPAPDAGEQPPVRCTACGRPLRDAESRARRLGPECSIEAFAARSFDVAQDQLPGMEQPRRLQPDGAGMVPDGAHGQSVRPPA